MRPNCIAYYRSLNRHSQVVKHSMLVHAEDINDIASNRNIVFILDETKRLKSCEIYSEIIFHDLDELNTDYIWNVGYLTLDEDDNEERYLYKAGSACEFIYAVEECKDAVEDLQISEYSKDFVL